MAFFTAGVGPAWLSQIILFLLRRMLGLVLVVVTVVPAAAQSPELHRAVKAGDLDGLTKLRKELGRTVRKMQPGYVFRDCEQCPEMVVVPAGRFRMGDLSGDDFSDEQPVHEVTIAAPFAVGRYEVTFAEWDACVTGGGCTHRLDDEEGWGRGPQPIIYISWKDAQGYVRWLSCETGQSYRLLSEAEWEYAARAGTGTKYWWGNEADHNYANYGRDEGYGGRAAGADRWVNTAPVGSFEANAFGLFDTAGNVLEWVEDCWNKNYAGAPADGSAWTSGDCNDRVLRGGSWFDIPRNLRSPCRISFDSGYRNIIFGFRVARTLTP